MAAEEKNAVEAVEAEVIEDGSTVTLMKPVNGKSVLVFHYEKITGGVLLKCEKLAKKEDPAILVPQTSMCFQAHVAAAATGMRYDDIIGLAAPDFMAVTAKALRFLSGGAE